MEDDLPDIDEKALRKVSRIDRAIQKMRRDDQGAFMAITNALEHHLEIYLPNGGPRGLGFLLELRARQIDAEAAGFSEQLQDLLDYA